MLLTAALLALASLPSEPPLRVTIRAGEKTHGPGEHDHPRFLADWSALLAERGATVAGGLAFPDEATLARTDVLVLYAAEGGSIHGAERERLERYLARGGGIVVLHDAVCGDDPEWFKTVVGGAWEHGRSKWQTGRIGLCFADREHPITKGVANFDWTDEIYWDLHLDPGAHVLANAFHTPFDVTPQMWTYEKDDYRAFVSIQGHYHASFEQPAWRTLLLRGIAWAGKREADLLVSPDEVAALRYPQGGPRAPEVAHEPMVLNEEFELTLVAAEPLVRNPISVDWDARGRMWVACTPGYPYKEESSGIPAHDEVRILHDDDGDGRMDRATTFFAGLDLVSSLVLHADGAIVTAAPHVLWLRDLDGDDRADRAEVLYTGFGTGDTHAVTSNLRWGMDGWIYGVQGYSGAASKDVRGFATEPRPVWSSPSAPGAPGIPVAGIPVAGIPVDEGLGTDGEGSSAGGSGSGESAGTSFGRIPNGLFRFRPDGSAIETVVSYGSNTWGLDFASDGELFFTMANGSHLRHVVVADGALRESFGLETPSWLDVTDHRDVHPLRDHERPPYQQIDFVGGFTGAAGSLVQDGGAWPDAFRGDHFVCEPTVNLVHRDALERDGATFRGTKPRREEFLASTDLWFRPVHVRSAPDGAMIVLDFYNQAAVHNDTRGPRHGPTNAAVRPDRDALHGRIWRVQHRDAVAVGGAALADLDGAALLAELGSASSWRRDVALRLLAEGRAPDMGELVLFSHQAAFPAARLRAVMLADRLGASDAEILAALEDPDAAVRWNAARILARRGPAGDPPEELLLLVIDDDPRVVLEALLAIDAYDHGDRFAREFAGDFVELYTELQDDWSRAALLQVYAEHAADLLEAALERDDLAPVEDLVAAMTALVARAGDAQRVAFALRSVSGGRAETAPATVVRLLRTAAAALAPDADLTQAADALRDLVAAGDVRVALAALPLAARLPDGLVETAPLFERLLALTADPDAELDERLAALDALFAMPDVAWRARGVDAARRFLDPYFPLATQIRVIDALGAAMGSRALEREGADALTGAFRSLSHAARERAFHHLVQRAPRAAALLDGIERGDLQANDLGPARRHRLELHPDEALAARARALLATPADGDKQALIAALLPLVNEPGDPRNGRLVFQENCATCHAFGGRGGAVGPDLTGVGAHGAAVLLPFLVDPNREVDPTYIDYVAETFDGRILTGVLVRETPAEIVLRSSSGEEVVRRDELDSLVSTGRSPMPAGLESLGAEALRDVLAYLGAGYEDFRIVDLSLSCTTTTNALYDAQRDARPMRFRATGVVDVGGVPFEILDPARVARNALALKGGLIADWDSKVALPETVVVPVGFALERVHVLGGIAAWGYPYTQSRAPILRWTWVYADGGRETLVLHDGDAFADWIGRHEVPGSVWVDLLEPGSPGQVRHFTLDPGRRGVAVEAIELQSFDNHLSPTFLALTARVRGADGATPVPPPWTPPAGARVLVFGGGTSHDYGRWYREEDLRTLAAAPELAGKLHYDEIPSRLAALLPQLDVLALCNNQPLPDPALREGVFAHADAGGGLLLLHAATWYNWPDWPEYNAALVGGGARSHESYGEFVVTVSDPAHPVMQGVRSSFGVADELYRFEPSGAIHVLATGTSVATGASYPVVWTVDRAGGRIVCTTLGHDGGAHELPEYRALLRNAVEWLAE